MQTLNGRPGNAHIVLQGLGLLSERGHRENLRLDLCLGLGYEVPDSRRHTLTERALARPDSDHSAGQSSQLLLE
eukprot:7794811-Alexandrium_andersonii.AAC.1